MIKVVLCCGIQASGKSTWAVEEVSKDPNGTIRINRDSLRNMLTNYTFNPENEKLVQDVWESTLRSGLKRGKSVILDETNIGKRNWEKVCKIVKETNIDCVVEERPFFVELDVALERNSKREGSAKIPEDVVRKYWKQSGGESFKDYVPRTETFKTTGEFEKPKLMEQDETLAPCVICDLDGTLALFGDRRSPYDASECDLVDEINPPVAETIRLFHQAGHKIIFCSGREDKYREATLRFLEKNIPDIKDFHLFMRRTGDFRKDNVVKKEIFESQIQDKYWVKLILDDRDQVCALWRELGLTCFQVAPGSF